jgi:hypothetical protein
MSLVYRQNAADADGICHDDSTTINAPQLPKRHPEIQGKSWVVLSLRVRIIGFLV